MRNAAILVPFCGRVELRNRRAVLLVRGGAVGEDAGGRARHFAWTSFACAHAIPVRIGRRKAHARMRETPPLRQAILPNPTRLRRVPITRATSRRSCRTKSS